MQRRQMFQVAGVAAVAGAGGLGWLYYGSRRSARLAGGPFRPYPFDPVAAENFQQKLFIPVASGPFGVLDVNGPLKIRATAASFPQPRLPSSLVRLGRCSLAGFHYSTECPSVQRPRAIRLLKKRYSTLASVSAAERPSPTPWQQAGSSRRW